MNTHNDSSSFICLAVLFQKKKALPASMCMNAGHAFSFKHMKRGFWVKIWSSSLTVASICMSFPFWCFVYGNILSCWNYMRIKGQCQRDGRNINDTLMRMHLIISLGTSRISAVGRARIIGKIGSCSWRSAGNVIIVQRWENKTAVFLQILGTAVNCWKWIFKVSNISVYPPEKSPGAQSWDYNQAGYRVYGKHL